jgi:hypothetical protein
MARIRIAIVLGITSLMLGLAGAAQAKDVPPGLAGAEQYVETTPTVTGGNPTSGGGGGGAGANSPGAVIGHANADRLSALGAEGQATARLAAEGAPKGARSGDGGGASAQSGSSPSGVRQVIGELTGTSSSGGMGPLLPLLIASGAIAAVAFGIGRRRAGRASQLDA